MLSVNLCDFGKSKNFISFQIERPNLLSLCELTIKYSKRRGKLNACAAIEIKEEDFTLHHLFDVKKVNVGLPPFHLCILF